MLCFFSSLNVEPNMNRKLITVAHANSLVYASAEDHYCFTVRRSIKHKHRDVEMSCKQLSGVSAPLECTTQQRLCLVSAQRGQLIKAGTLPSSEMNETIQPHFVKTQHLMKWITGSLAASLVT